MNNLKQWLTIDKYKQNYCFPIIIIVNKRGKKKTRMNIKSYIYRMFQLNFVNIIIETNKKKLK